VERTKRNELAARAKRYSPAAAWLVSSRRTAPAVIARRKASGPGAPPRSETMRSVPTAGRKAMVATTSP
jgi:hypothetical protein